MNSSMRAGSNHGGDEDVRQVDATVDVENTLRNLEVFASRNEVQNPNDPQTSTYPNEELQQTGSANRSIVAQQMDDNHPSFEILPPSRSEVSGQSARDNPRIQIPERGVHIGDTIINTPSPVFSGPVTQNVIYQSSTIVSPTATEQPNLDQTAREKYEELQALSKEKVNSIASEGSSLAEFLSNPIEPVNLSIVSKPQQIDDEFIAEGHYHRRNDFLNSYERSSSKITANQIFTRAKQNAQEEANRRIQESHVEARHDHVLKHGNVAAILGQPGIGKTTALKKWALQALSAAQLFGSVTLFFYIAIRFVDFDKNMTFLQFLLHTMIPEWECTEDVAKRIIEEIVKDANVLIFFDGLDEAAFKSFARRVSVPLLHSKNKAELYLKHLAGGKLLPQARKIFTSRPGPFYNLDPEHRPKFVVEIRGLTARSQEELGRQICGDRYDDVKLRLDNNSGLFAYCYVPLNHILTVNYLMRYGSRFQIVPFTRVLAFTCVDFFETDHLRATERVLNKICKLAWDGFQNKRVVFDLTDLKKFEITESTADAFLIASITKQGNLKLAILDGHKRRYFSHLVWQEFFTAVYLMMLMPMKVFKKQIRRLRDERWEVVSKCAFGLCNREVFDCLKAIVPGCLLPNWLSKKELLTTYVSAAVNERQEVILQACSWAYEAQDDKITAFVSLSFPDEVDFSVLTLQPTDFENFSFVLQAARAKPVRKVSFAGNLVRLTEAISISKCIHNMEEVDLGSCDLTSRCVGELSTAIRSSPKQMELVVLSRNLLTDESAKSLVACVHNVKILNLKHNDFSQLWKDRIRQCSRGRVVF